MGGVSREMMLSGISTPTRTVITRVGVCCFVTCAPIATPVIKKKMMDCGARRSLEINENVQDLRQYGRDR